MKRLDKLLKQARRSLSDVLTALFPADDDAFIEALGVDPARYRVEDSAGNVGYDFMAALNDTAVEVWGNYAD